jgi:hypothetical protein
VEPGKILLCGTWQFPLLHETEIDLFWNCASFQEMEPDVVENYLAIVGEVARAIYLMEAMEGKEVAPTAGKHGVLKATVMDDYRRALPRFELVDARPPLQPDATCITSRGYADSFWRRCR